MKRIVLFILFGLSVILPVRAEVPDWYDADELIRTACKKSLEIYPSGAEQAIKSQIAARLAATKNLQEIMEYAKTNPTVLKQIQWDSRRVLLYEALKKKDFEFLKHLVLSVDPYNQYDLCEEIAEHCVANGYPEEGKKFIEQLKENKHGHKSIAMMEYNALVFASFCAKKDEHGKVSTKTLQNAFHFTAQYNDRLHRFLIAELFWGYSGSGNKSDVFEQLREAVRLTRNGEDAKAKKLFETIFNSIPNRGFPDVGGAVNPAQYLCGIAAVQIEIGKPEWAKELLPKIVIPERDNFMQQYAIGLCHNIANIQIALGDIQAARKTIEGIGEPIFPPIWCDLAVILAKHGDKKGCNEIVDKIIESFGKEDHGRRLETNLKIFQDVLAEINDADLSRRQIDRILNITKYFKDKSSPDRSFTHDQSSTRSFIETVAMNLMLHEKRFEDAHRLLTTGIDIRKWGNGNEEYVSALIVAQKYNEAEKFLYELPSSKLQCEMMCKIARLQHEAGKDEDAAATLQKGIEFAITREFCFGGILDKQHVLIDIAMDIKEYRNVKSERPAMKIADEVFQWHRKLITRAASESKDFTEEDLQHLLLIVGHTRSSSGYKSSKTEVKKLKELGEAIYPTIIKTALNAPDSFVAAYILKILDVSKGDKKELHKAVWQVYEKLPESVDMWKTFCQIMSEIGEPADVPKLLLEVTYFRRITDACLVFEKIAVADQLPEIEKKFTEIKKQTQDKYPSIIDEYWNKEIQPNIDNAFKAIRNRK
ncbi:MAG: hypothetical protein LBR10_00025 [Prevotellaceae bacterium]|jgi:hypothetical protein|nr:hypothetical protein [Prevotellaceae bacterium]